MEPADRRRWPRFEAPVRLTFRDSEKMQEEMVRNLSRGGCLTRSLTSRQLGARVPLVLTHPESGKLLHLSGEVRRCDPLPDGSFGLGVMFLDLDEESRERIGAFVQSVAATRGEAARCTAESLHSAWRLALVREVPRSLAPPLARLAGLVDGRRTVAQVIDLSGMPSDRATAGIVSLVQSGLVLEVPPGVPVSAVVGAPGAPAREPEGRPGIGKKAGKPGRTRLLLLLAGVLLLALAAWALGSSFLR